MRKKEKRETKREHKRKRKEEKGETGNAIFLLKVISVENTVKFDNIIIYNLYEMISIAMHHFNDTKKYDK